MNRSHPDAPVVVFTSYADPRDKRCAFELGVKEVIEKPTDLTEYRRVVSEMVRRWAA